MHNLISVIVVVTPSINILIYQQDFQNVNCCQKKAMDNQQRDKLTFTMFFLILQSLTGLN